MLSARLEIKAGNFILNLKVGGETTFALSVGNVYIDTISWKMNNYEEPPKELRNIPSLLLHMLKFKENFFP